MTRYEVVNAALSTNVGKSNRAEDLEDYQRLFVDPINTNVLEGNANQLVFGRRGSGKTLLFGALTSRIQESFPDTRRLAFYYTATSFRSSPDYGTTNATVKQRTHAFFHKFIEDLCTDIFEFADQVLKQTSWLSALRLWGDENRDRRELLVTRVLELLEAARIGIENPSLTSVRATQTHQQRDATSGERKTGIDAKLDATGEIPIGFRANLSALSHAAHEKSTERTVLYEPVRVFSPALVRRKIVEIVELLELDYIVIFIDEWMSLQECQIEFAERLRQCLFGERRIAVKVAADRFQGQFNNSGTGHQFRGLDIGGDIFPAVDLDEPFRNPERSFELFSEALYRRLLHCEPALQHYFGDPPLANPVRFITTIFDNRHAFDEACRGAQGLCRDFHEVVQECTKRIGWDVQRQRIDYQGVQNALVAQTHKTYERVASSVDSNPLLIGMILPHIRDRASRYFLLEAKHSRTTAVINDLQSKRIIHKVPSEFVDASLKPEYNLYEVHYGIFLDLMRAREYGGALEKPDFDPSEVGSINRSNVDGYLLPLEELERAIPPDEESRLCPHCGIQFSTVERAFQVRNICPACFQDQPN